nr:gastrula zinc finger protein XlCGF26.1-like [Lytechinus pictus]
MTSANIDENTMSNELPGVPQGALLCTTFSSNELRANHAMTSLEKTLELVRKRKNGLSNSEATSSKNMKRKRKPIKPTKSIQYCKETERLIKENLSSRALTASDETDQVMLIEDGSSTLGDEQFSPFFTEHQHSLLNFKQYECLKCGQDFASRKAMNIHIQTHCEETPFWCTECNQSFTNNHLYMMHMQIHRPYECDDCGANCADSTTLHKHKLFHLDSKNFQCPLCPKVFKQRAGLACHRMNAHPEMASDIKPFWCAECNKGFTQNHSYKAHMRIHSGERPYLCKECGAAFADNKTLQNHKALHSDERTFKCTLCPKMFRQRAGLACHMKTHTDEKPFVCELCGQRVKTKSTLKNHLRIHSEEKPYKCPLCPQAFKQRAGLACHSKVHEKCNPV